MEETIETMDGQTYRADLVLHGCGRSASTVDAEAEPLLNAFSKLLVDLTIADPAATSVLPQSSQVALKAADRLAATKRAHYARSSLRDLNYVPVPVVFEAYGAWHKTAVGLLNLCDNAGLNERGPDVFYELSWATPTMTKFFETVISVLIINNTAEFALAKTAQAVDGRAQRQRGQLPVVSEGLLASLFA